MNLNHKISSDSSLKELNDYLVSLELILSSIERKQSSGEYSLDLSLEMYHFQGLALVAKSRISKAGDSGLWSTFQQVYSRYLSIASNLPGKE